MHVEEDWLRRRHIQIEEEEHRELDILFRREAENEIVGFVLKSWKLMHQHVLLIRQDVRICTLLHLVFTLDSHFLLAEQGKRWRKRKMP